MIVMYVAIWVIVGACVAFTYRNPDVEEYILYPITNFFAKRFPENDGSIFAVSMFVVTGLLGPLCYILIPLYLYWRKRK